MNLRNIVYAGRAALLTACLCFVWTCSDDDDGGSKVSGPLAVPTNVVYTSTETSIHFGWGKVTNATSYEATLASEDVPSSKETVQTADTQCDFENLEEGYYIFTLTALFADDPAYNSEACEMRVATRGFGVEALLAPTVTAVITTHGMSIMEWDLSGEAQNQQALSDDDPYDFRVADANGNVLRVIEDCCDWGFDMYCYKRVAFGGLEPDTSYRLGVRRLSKTSSYGSSDWAEVEIKTESAPDKTDYLLYWDFENVPFCANPQYRAYGFKYNGNTETDYSDPNSLNYAGVYHESIWGEKIDPSGNSKHNNQSFYDNYLPGLTVDDFNNQDCFNIAVSVGMLKFGGSNQQTWLTLPALTELTGPTDILIEFDASPYYEPDSSTGNKFEVNNADVLSTFYLEVTGDGTIDSSSLEQGESDSGKIATLKLPTLDDGIALGWGDDRYYFAPKSVVVNDATGDTRIKFYTVALSGVTQQRMWMDNIRICVYTK